MGHFMPQRGLKPLTESGGGEGEEAEGPMLGVLGKKEGKGGKENL